MRISMSDHNKEQIMSNYTDVFKGAVRIGRRDIARGGRWIGRLPPNWNLHFIQENVVVVVIVVVVIALLSQLPIFMT